ncbi:MULTISPECIES: hypothetical protein [unclassified Fibrobacter]|uniref:hypothetical protein n=1 Tax=unclassified Fibrobacter TaxID=2634177 RepID=UPI00091466D3|nr:MULTISPECIES: hypothetical protein [unclassified Fibrobacter]OWV05303.1 hypothetical protein B7993_08500 [Fibrobacter sp. UWH3]SHL29501.1 hypothetical protein SAMN05720765_11297 [Fibrobacter sp. UWH6]
MGITIKSKNFSLDCGYFGFKRLRDFVASKRPHENFRKCVEEFNENILSFMRPAGWMESFNKKINDLEFLANKGSTKEEIETLDWFGNFEWASDCDAEMKYETAKAIWEYIKDVSEDFVFGYSARPDAATFQQFKSLIDDCVKNKTGFKWC